MNIHNFVSFLGIFFLLAIAWLFSRKRDSVNWRVVVWGVGLQLLCAGGIFYLPVGVQVFKGINSAVIRLLSFAYEGMYFVFGPLAVPPGVEGPLGEKSLGFILVFQALPAVIFFSALMAILYQVGVMQHIVGVFAKIFTRLMKISGAESLCASSNIVVGIESVFTIRPYIEEMTSSELCTVMTVGMATIASTVMAIYVSFLYPQFPTIAGHLVSASLLSAPAGIVMAKLLCPETQIPKTLGKAVQIHYQKSSGWIEAVIKGSFEGVKLLVGIVALLLSFLALLAMANWFLSLIGGWISPVIPQASDLSLQKILSYLFYPFTFFMGVPWQDIPEVARLLGERTIVTELVSYQHLGQYLSHGTIQIRSGVIAAYALCGFAHIASLAIFIGGISSLAPSRVRDLGSLGFRSLFAATLACLMTGAVAGFYMSPSSTRLFSF
ncbi:MAG: nucleoside transporter [Candidatus Omnitrophica bacterium]|nr:nucleoside transporter [Candidatus Omnitrophota bacterium]